MIIDRCFDHGTWLDADELEQITGFILSGGRPKSEQSLEPSSSDRQEPRAGAAFARIMAEERAGPFKRQNSGERGIVGSFLGLLDSLLG